MDQKTYILHITTQEAWDAAESVGEYRTESLEEVGFIHFSTPDQVVNVANTLYSGREDLTLLVVDPEQLSVPLRWETPADAPEDMEKFPHLYGPLKIDEVVAVVNFPVGPDGAYTLPDAVRAFIGAG